MIFRFNIFLSIFLFLIFILSIEGTIALRYLLTVLLLIILIFKKTLHVGLFRKINSNKQYKNIVLVLLIFLLYVLIHTFFLSHNLVWSIDEWRAQILYPVVFFFIGNAIAYHVKFYKLISPRSFIKLIFFALFLHIIYVDMRGLHHLIQSGEMLNRFGGLMSSPVLANYITNIVIAILTSEYIYRLRTGHRFMNLSNGFLHLALISCIFSAFVESLRLGDISLVLLGISAAILFAYRNSSFTVGKKTIITSAIVVILTVPLAYNISTDPRWGKLKETIPLAINTSSSRHWVNENLDAPKTKSGYEVKGSNYERVAWAKKGLDFVIENPWGIGFGRNSFGHSLYINMPEEREFIHVGQTSHSSIIDLTIGIGLLGTSLWVMFIFYVAYSSAKIFFNNHNYFAILAIFLSVGFFSRGLVDANMRDHMLVQFMILLGITLFFLFSDEDYFEKDIPN